jgi:signal peptidase I
MAFADPQSAFRLAVGASRILSQNSVVCKFFICFSFPLILNSAKNKKQGKESMQNNKKNSTARDWVNTIFWGGLIAIVFRSFLLEPFNIPSGSMIPTMEVGDHIFVKKWSYGYSRYSFPFGSWNLWNGRFFASQPKLGDVIVFRKPGAAVDYVKRLVGLPGDTVQVSGGILNINGKPVVRENPRPYIIANLPKSVRSSGFAHGEYVIRRGKVFKNDARADFNYTIEYKADSICQTRQHECQTISATEWTETLPNGVRHSIVEISDNGPFDNTTEFRVPENSFFMMGDDRDLSADSRAGVGFVPRENLLGRVWFVWYSHNYYSPMLAIWNWGDKIRWNRLGLGIH